MADDWTANQADAVMARLRAAAPTHDAWKERQRQLNEQHAARQRARARGRNHGTEPTPTDRVFRAQSALVPPHLSTTLREIEAEERRVARALDRCRALGLYPDVAILPSWVYRVAARIHASDELAQRELAQLPVYNRERILRAAGWARSVDARRNVIVLGVCLTWLSLRRPGRCGTPSTIAGIPHAMLLGLTRKSDGSQYSESAVFHGWHGRERGEHVGPRGMTWGDPEAGQVGLLPLLQLAGALHVWLPPPNVEPWMRGPSGFAFACYRARLADPASDDAWWSLEAALSRVRTSPLPS